MSPPPRTGIARRAAWALVCLLVFSMPWEKSIMLPGLGTFTRLVGMLAFAGGVAAAVERRSLRRPNLAMAFAALFAAWSGATWLWSLDRAATLTRATTLAELFAMLWLIWDACRGPARQRQLMQAYVWGAVAASATAWVRYLEHQQTYYRRYAAAGFDPNDFGLILALAIPPALYLALEARGWRRWCYQGAVLAVVSAVVLTASRTALVATLVALVFALWTWRRADIWLKVTTVLMFLLLAVGTLQFAPAPARNRLATLPTELSGGTFHGRTRIWKAGLKVLKRHPVRGVGAGAYPAAVRPWLGVPGVPGHFYVAHNTFLSVLVECGAIGFALYALYLATLAFYIRAMPPVERALWAVVAAAWTVGVSTLTWEQYKPSWLMAALIMTAWARSYWAAGESAK